MREILFRGKRTDNGEWVKGFYVCILDTHYIMTGKFDSLTNGIINSEAYHVDFSTVGRFAGLTDRNGVKIFEGDIVKFGNKTYEIKFIEKYSRFAGTNAHCVFASFLLNTSEIIGNIHDNPELMDESTADEDELAEKGE